MAGSLKFEKPEFKIFCGYCGKEILNPRMGQLFCRECAESREHKNDVRHAYRCKSEKYRKYVNNYQKKWRQIPKNKAKLKAYRERPEVKERMRKTHKEWIQNPENREKERIKARERYAKNKKKIVAKRKKLLREHPEIKLKRNKVQLAWYYKNREKILARRRENYQKKNLEETQALKVIKEVPIQNGMQFDGQQLNIQQEKT